MIYCCTGLYDKVITRPAFLIQIRQLTVVFIKDKIHLRIGRRLQLQVVR
jgi:hypothetical protein